MKRQSVHSVDVVERGEREREGRESCVRVCTCLEICEWEISAEKEGNNCIPSSIATTYYMNADIQHIEINTTFYYYSPPL
mmetsp:Transcript_23014/g.34538  ORF Transcript_23014/g.34538 Transcript_23014/m.34538 type:complete len:80 (+) Transcript_23014:210-449(+)